MPIETIQRALKILEPIAFTDANEETVQAVRQAADIIGNAVLNCVQQEHPDATSTELARVEFVVYRYIQNDINDLIMNDHRITVQGPHKPVVWIVRDRRLRAHVGETLHRDQLPPDGDNAYENAGNGGVFAVHMQNVGTYYFPTQKLGQRMTKRIASRGTTGKTPEEIHEYRVKHSKREELQVGEILPVNSIFHVAPDPTSPYDNIDISQKRWLARVWIKGHNLQFSASGDKYNFRQQLIAKPFKFRVHLKN